MNSNEDTPIAQKETTADQRSAVERWEKTGWVFLHWTEIPQIMAVLEHPLGDVIFIDAHGWAWKGPTFSRSNAVPFDKYPLVSQDE